MAPLSEANKKQLDLVLKTLDRIELHGKDNLDMMLGVMLALEKLGQDEPIEQEENNG